MSSLYPKSNLSTKYLFLHMFLILCSLEMLETGRRERQAQWSLSVSCLWQWGSSRHCRRDMVSQDSAEGVFMGMWKHIHIFNKVTIYPSPVHFIFSWHVSNWARWKMFPILGSLSTCQPFNFIVPNLLLIRLQNVSGWPGESDLF